MDKIPTILAVIDAAIQRKFDAFIFLLMRVFGWQKSFIRYLLWCVTIISITVNTYIGWVLNGRKLGGGEIFAFVILALALFMQWGDRFLDRVAEERRMYSAADRPVKGDGFFKLIFWFFSAQWAGVIVIVWLLPFKNTSPGEIMMTRIQSLASFFFFSSFLAIEYLKRTPPIPPPREEKLKVLVPAREHSS